MNRQLDVEYNNFLIAFHAQHRYLRPPTFQEWLMSMNMNQYIVNNNVKSFVPVNNVNIGNVNTTPVSSKTKKSKTVDFQTKQTRTKWSQIETDVLVTEWKNNYLKLHSLDKEETFKKIEASVNLVGKKSLLQCKAKLKNMKDKYKQAKNAIKSVSLFLKLSFTG